MVPVIMYSLQSTFCNMISPGLETNTNGRDRKDLLDWSKSHDKLRSHDQLNSRDHPLLDLPLGAARDQQSRNRQDRCEREDVIKLHNGIKRAYEIVRNPPDERLGNIDDDPRGNDPTKRITKKACTRGHGRNTESFDPASTLVRPDLRIQIGSPALEVYNKSLKHDDVVIVPELFGRENDWDLYYKLVEEMRCVQSDPRNSNSGDNRADANKIEVGPELKKGSEWIPWHEGAHLITKNPKGSPTYNKIVSRLCEYFSIDPNKIGTRFNWYRDSSDWKPFHHDSAAFNPQRSRSQNITIGASFGATRELAFIRTKDYRNDDLGGGGEKCKLYFPQTNNGVFSFGRDANINWKVRPPRYLLKCLMFGTII
mmetsp:Transcript_4089/g.7879  ORF Transcript_4089/g.7879 Transcript_4089/m.7879 type:complete len:368 (-) Transcript_4089:724-1827(-)